MPEFSWQVFLSYSRKEAAWAKRLNADLTARGYRIFLDGERLIAGEAWNRELQHALERSQHLLVLWSESAKASDWVLREIYSFRAISDDDPERRLICVNLADENKALAEYQQINLFQHKTLDAVLSQPALWNTVIEKIEESIRAAGAQPERPWHVPYRHNPWFAGREKELDDLATKFQPNGHHLVTGIAGVGKTQILVEYAYRHRDEHMAVLWVNGGSEDTIESDFVHLAAALKLPERRAQETRKVRDAVTRWLQGNRKWLLILDNVNAPEPILPLISLADRGVMVIVSQVRDLQGLEARSHTPIEELSSDGAVELLRRRTEHTAEPFSTEAAGALAQALGCLPLALEQAASYITAKNTSISDYLQSYKSRSLELLDSVRPATGSYPRSVQTAWEMNFDEVKKAPAAAELLLHLAFTDADAIPREVIAQGGMHMGELISSKLRPAESDPLVVDDLLEPLTRYALISRGSGSIYRMHRLVQQVIVFRMSEDERRVKARQVVEAINAVFPFVEFKNWERCERLVPQALRAKALVNEFGVESTTALRLINNAGYYLRARARYTLAEQMYRQALSLAEKLSASEYPDVALALNNLASLLYQLGDLKKAAKLCHRALRIIEASPAADQRYLGFTLDNLALMLMDDEQFDAAEPLLHRARHIWLRLEEPEHLGTSVMNLARLLESSGRPHEAEHVHREALALVEQAHPGNHPDVASALHNLAVNLHNIGKLDEAEPFYMRGMEMRKRMFEPQHPDLANSLAGLAQLMEDWGRLADAQDFYRDALAILQRTFGVVDPLYLAVRSKYVGVQRRLQQRDHM
jgi:tetratricopeptide (TPR) repeat protein